MKVSEFALIALLGLGTPLLVQGSFPAAVEAQSLPVGNFANNTWYVSIDYYNNTLTYYGENKRNRSNIHLQGARVGGDAQRRIYTWTNGDIRYQVAWRPSEPHTIRVQVFNGRGQEILNQLLTRV